MRPIVIDTGAQKEALAHKIGAEAFIDFKRVDSVAAEVVKVADGIGAHGVIVTAWQTYKGNHTAYSSSHKNSRLYDRLGILHRRPHWRYDHVHRSAAQGCERCTWSAPSTPVLPEAQTYRQHCRLDARRSSVPRVREKRTLAIDLRSTRFERVSGERAAAEAG